jgi:hypothetical protein
MKTKCLDCRESSTGRCARHRINDHRPNVDQLARDFVMQLRRSLTRQEWRELGDRNFAETNPAVCHSHDFCDSNVVMAEVFDNHGADVDDRRLWADVWSAAMPMMTRIPCPTIYPERTTHWADGRIETKTNVPCEGSLAPCPVCGARRWCGYEARCLDDQTPTHWVRQRFGIEDETYGYADGVPGWTRGERWNGWACPRFERTEAAAIVAYLADSGVSTAFFAADDSIHLQMDGGDDEVEIIPPTTIETADGPRVVYGLGAWSWIWSQFIQQESEQ